MHAVSFSLYIYITSSNPQPSPPPFPLLFLADLACKCLAVLVVLKKKMVVNLSLCSRRQVIRLCSTRFGLKRHESIASTAISGAESLLVGMRSLDIMPWSAVICSTAVVARLGLLLPIAIKSEIYRTRLELLSPTLREWTDALRFKVYATCRREGKTQEEADKVLKIKVCR